MIEVETAQRYLEQFGYFESPVVEAFGFASYKAFAPPLANPGEFDVRTRVALSAFQEFVGLPITGELDEATIAWMERPRCGFPDVGEFVLQGNKWLSKELTYTFRELTPELSFAQIQAATAAALKLWSDVSGLSFTELHPSKTTDMVIRFVAGEHGDTFAFDGPGNVLAHAFFPPPNGGALAGDAHFDEGEDWVVSGQGVDYITVAAHEFGHALGLAHSPIKGALMYPYYGGPARFLSADDKAGIQALYGSKPVVSAPTPTPQPPVEQPPSAPSSMGFVP